MACACNKGKKKQYEVTHKGKVVFTTPSRPTADAVSKRYVGSVVREKSNTPATRSAAPAVTK